MQWYGSVPKSSGSETSLASYRTSPRRSKKPRIPSISIGISDISNQPLSFNTFGSVMPDVTSEVDLNTNSETDIEDRKSYTPNILEKSFERIVCYHLKRRKKAPFLVIVLLCVLTIVTNAAVLIISPIYTWSMKKSGGDEAVVLLSLAAVVPVPLVVMLLLLKHTYDKTITLKPSASMVLYGALGLCQSLRLNMGVYASHPVKTPRGLQSGLSGVVVVFSVIVVLVVFRKGFSKRCLGCCFAALVGVFISVEPRIWSLEGSEQGTLFSSHDLVAQILWPAIFCLSYLPLTVYNVLFERELRKNQIHPFSLSTSAMLSTCVFIVFMSTTDFLPWYGNVKNIPEFWDKIKTGFTCNFSYANECQHCLVKMVVMGASFALFNTFSLLLVYTSDGSVFASLVMCVSVPLASGFWTVFQYDYQTDTIVWKPWWSHTTSFLLVSIAILLPSLIAYSYFSKKDVKEVKREKNGYSDVSSSEYEWD
ncbi:hypothetical protein BsWGS_03387 [Bradybaena similaris]